MNFTIRQLIYFITVVQVKTLSKAADYLYISQPNLSKNITALEDTLGIQLFRRTSTGMEPTEAALKIFPKALDIVSSCSSMETLCKELRKGTSGTLTFASLMPLYKPFLKILNAFTNQYSNISYRFKDEYFADILSDLYSEQIDAAVAYACNRELFSNIEFLKIKNSHWAIALPQNHPLAQSKTISLEQIKKEKLISANRDKVGLLLDKKIYINTGLIPEYSAFYDSFQELLTAVGAGKGILPVPEDGVPEDTYNIVVKPVDIPPEQKRLDIYILFKKGCQKSEVLTLRKFLFDNHYVIE